MLAYIIAALIWWFIALTIQNNATSKFRINDLHRDDPKYEQHVIDIHNYRDRKHAQYVGEGVTFLLLIVAAAIYIFRVVRRQLRQSQQQQHFMMAIGHELKTPVAVAKLNLETILKHKLDETTQVKLIQNTLQETNRLNSLCNNLLLASQMESGYSRTIETLNISEVLSSTVEEFIEKYSSRVFEMDINKEVFIKGDNLMLYLLFSNLLDNAVKYSKEKITVSLKTEKNTSIIEIIDEGIGIPDKEKNKIFEKNYRIGNEATKLSKGTGLGLYLSRRITLAHKGKITVTNNLNGGAVFSLQLPLV